MSEQTNQPDQNDNTETGTDTGEDRPTIGASTPQANTTEKDPEQWVTGDEPMTGAQRSYLDTLAREAGEELPADLTKAQASEHIDRLQSKTGRGDSGN
ncbi:DUF3072 domain-containing protein [Tersicoccus sp. Bi-70]|uniref:DUF3072 domain-containing protein n=1 Tax=Tersicoccus sp. Bi-70 TaxID=1897634 RepID=UPI000976CFC4|nr:DUF3072 domain-containing protein [Tersicoccus sp. Bi-70]OMH35082.1 DUF3072 domain-containing protein [Tersicoccus sp. Bi-70]